MNTLSYQDTLIIFEDIPDGERSDRHKRERQTVEGIITQMFDSSVTLAHRPSGAPYLKGRDDLHISISHSSAQVVIAISNNGPIGIDTETLRPQLERVKDKYLTQAEQADWPTPTDRLTAWCIKEAAYKIADRPGTDFTRDIIITRPGKVTVAGAPYRYAIIESSPTQSTVLVIPEPRF